MSETFVIGDSHSNYKSVVNLLIQEGLVLRGKRLRPKVNVIHLGDLVNGTSISRDDDLKCLSMVGQYIDILLIGNHESPHLGFPRFAGCFEFPEIKERLRELMFKKQLLPAYAAGNILLSHAGVAKNLGEELEGAENASQVALRALWEKPRNPLLWNIGRSRGGFDKEGGIFWSDWLEPKTDKFPQIIGHTADGPKLGRKPFHPENNDWEPPNHTFELDDGDVLNIDIGCNSTGFSPSNALAGTWIRDGKIKFVKYSE